MATKKFGAISSSQNPEEISNRIKGITLALSSVIIFASAKFFGVTLTAQDVATLATQFGMIGGAVWTIYGTGMAVWAKLFRTE